MLREDITLYDRFGKAVTPRDKLRLDIAPRKFSMGLVGNMFTPDNLGTFRNHYYVPSDSDQGLDSFSRELVMRWSREMAFQLPIISIGVRLMSQYCVGNEYNFEYVGDNQQWGKQAEKYVNDTFYKTCCVRGNAYDWQTTLNLALQLCLIDGDLLFIYGQPDGMPQFQVVPSHRIRSPNSDNAGTALGKDGEYEVGNVKDAYVGDGVVYEKDTGEAVGWNVVSINNLMNQVESLSNTFVAKKNANLFFSPIFFDKHRGLSSFGAGILKCISISELSQFLIEKAKIESTVGLIVATPSGLGPQSLADTKTLIEQINGGNSDAMPGSYGRYVPGVQVINGATTRYIRADGGDLRSLTGNTTGENTLKFMADLEKSVLALIGVPRQMIFDTDTVSGKMNDIMMLNFHTAIRNNQKILDKQAKRIISWALSVAMKNKILPTNSSEDITTCFKFTHPRLPDINANHTRNADIADLENNIKTLPELLAERGKPLPKHMAELKESTTEFFKTALEVSKDTGVDINTVLAFMNKKAATAGMGAPAEIVSQGAN